MRRWNQPTASHMTATAEIPRPVKIPAAFWYWQQPASQTYLSRHENSKPELPVTDDLFC
jgi:hypothetical protein